MPSLTYETVEAGNYNDIRWWSRDLSDLERHKKLISAINAIRKTQNWRKESDLRHMRLYGNAPILGFGLANYSRPASLTGSKVGLNVVKNCSDAFVAKITKERPKISFITSGADWDMQQKAKALEKFVEGQLYALGLYDMMPQVVLDASIFGTGFLKFYISGEGKDTCIKAERVFPWEIVIDEQEGLYGAPRNWYQRKWIDRKVLEGIYGTTADLKQKIARAKRDTDDVDGLGYNSTADQILVTEAWHLPPKEDLPLEETGGRHTIAIENTVLFDEPYAAAQPPFVVYYRLRPALGFWGTGLAEELMGLQLELNLLMQKIQRGYHIMGNGHWLVENSSKINTQKITNDFDIIRYSGVKPDVITPEPIPASIFAHVDRIYQRSYEITGISQLEAQSQKPKGLNSGKAIDAYLDITTERFAVSQQLYHSMFIDIARMILCLASEIVHGRDGKGGENKNFFVMAHEKGAKAKRVEFKCNELEKDEYILKMYPTNSLADDPSERMAQVERMTEAGWIDAQDAKRLLDMPDLERAADLENAAYDAVEMSISKMLKDGEYLGPQPFLDLTTGMRQVQMALIRAWVDGAPEDRLQLLRQWLSDAQELLARATQATAPPVMPGGPQPQAQPVGGPAVTAPQMPVSGPTIQ